MIWERLLQLVSDQLLEGDLAMAQSHVAWHGSNLDPRFSFKPGMLVLLRQKVTNKN